MKPWVLIASLLGIFTASAYYSTYVRAARGPAHHSAYVRAAQGPAHRQPESLEAIFHRANTAYNLGHYTNAAKDYQRLIALGVQDPDVYFNLGTAYAKLEKYGHAIRALERAFRLNPSDTRIEKAIALANQMLAERHTQSSEGTLVQYQPPFLHSLLRRMTLTFLGILSLCLNIVCFGLLIIKRIFQRETLNLIATVGSGTTALGLFITGALILAKLGIGGHDEAIVLHDQASLRQGPTSKATEHGQALEGEHTLVLNKEGEYYLVSFTDGRRGWMHAKNVGKI